MLNELDRGPKHPTKAVPGIFAGDMNATMQRSVRDCRLSASKRPHVRVKAPVGVCSGYVREAHTLKPVSKNARRKTKRYGKGL